MFANTKDHELTTTLETTGRVKRTRKSPRSFQRELASSLDGNIINEHLRAANNVSSLRLRSSTFQSSQQTIPPNEDREITTEEESVDKRRSSARAHNTRLRNGIQKAKRKVAKSPQKIKAKKNKFVFLRFFSELRLF